jgi:hypothetical protein
LIGRRSRASCFSGSTRFCLAFATLTLLAFSWRASLVVATCTLLDFLGMIVAGMPDAGFWNTARLMLGLGLFLGAVTSFGDQRANYWGLAALALAVNVVLALSWGSGLVGLGSAWAGYVSRSSVCLPVACAPLPLSTCTGGRKGAARKGAPS